MAEKLEKMLAKAIEDITPDVYEKVLEQPETAVVKDDPVLKSAKKKKPQLQKAVYIAVGIAAMLCLVCGLGWYQFLDANTTIGLDVNPSLEFSVNRQNRVTQVRAYNEDAQIVTESLDLKNVEIQTAVSAVLGSMLQHGYLTDEQNAVLLTVQNADGEKAEELKTELLKNIDSVLAGNGAEGRIVSQVLEEDEGLKKLSSNHHVSCGKMKLIQNILSKDDAHTVQELNSMSVQELMELVGDEQINLHGHMEYEEEDFCKNGHTDSTTQEESHHREKKNTHHGENSHE